jgi:hypothetical protein
MPIYTFTLYIFTLYIEESKKCSAKGLRCILGKISYKLRALHQSLPSVALQLSDQQAVAGLALLILLPQTLLISRVPPSSTRGLARHHIAFAPDADGTGSRRLKRGTGRSPLAKM